MVRIGCEAFPLKYLEVQEFICVPKGGYAAKRRRPEVFLEGRKI